jgi:hypothetical protein
MKFLGRFDSGEMWADDAIWDKMVKWAEDRAKKQEHGMSEWINKHSSYPPVEYFEDVSVYVLVTDGKEVGIGTYRFDDRVWTYSMAGKVENDDNSITHWMPLPATPTID